MIHHRNQKITPTQGKTVFLSDELLHEVLVSPKYYMRYYNVIDFSTTITILDQGYCKLTFCSIS
jgi:hypothetical protein